MGGFPDGPVVRTPHVHCQECRSIPGRGAKILQATQHAPKNQKKKKRTMVLFLLYKNTSISSHFQTGYSLVVLLFPYNCVLRIRYLLWVLHQRSPSEDIFLFTSPTASQVHFNKHLFLSFMAANNIVVLLHIFKHLQVYSQI